MVMVGADGKAFLIPNFQRPQGRKLADLECTPIVLRRWDIKSLLSCAAIREKDELRLGAEERVVTARQIWHVHCPELLKLTARVVDVGVAGLDVTFVLRRNFLLDATFPTVCKKASRISARRPCAKKYAM